MKELVTIVFSKNRPLQLDLCLRSFYKYCQDSSDYVLKVIYKTTNQDFEFEYEKLKKEYPQINFIKETNFKENVMNCLKGKDFIFFMVDDNVIVRDFRLYECVDTLLENGDCLGFSLRLGGNCKKCFSLDCHQVVPYFCGTSVADIRKFDWTKSEYDFNYPLEISSSIFDTRIISNILNMVDFKNPNELESYMAMFSGYFSKTHPFLLCFDISRCFCIPCNKVQVSISQNNRCGLDERYSVYNLLKIYKEGVRINPEKIYKHIPNGCHELFEYL